MPIIQVSFILLQYPYQCQQQHQNHKLRTNMKEIIKNGKIKNDPCIYIILYDICICICICIVFVICNK